MVTNRYKVIALAEIVASDRFLLRDNLDDTALFDSVLKRGVLNPILVLARQDQYEVVAGHKRLYAAEKAKLQKIPALEIDSAATQEELFFVSLLSNWRQEFSELERFLIIQKAKAEFQLSPDVLLKEVLPCLGLAAEAHVLKEYENIERLESTLLDFLASDQLSLRAAKSLLRLKQKDQKTFANRLLAKVSLSVSQIQQSVEWLLDLLQISNISLEALLDEKEVQAILVHEQWDKRQKGEKLIEFLRGKRYPQLLKQQKAFAKVAQEFSRENQDIRIEASAYFEDEGIVLRAKLRRPESLEEVKTLLESKSKLLNSLFDIML